MGGYKRKAMCCIDDRRPLLRVAGYLLRKHRNGRESREGQMGLKIFNKNNKKNTQRKQPNRGGGGPTTRNETQGSESQKSPSYSTCFPLRLQTPESSNGAIRGGERAGENSERVVEKESVIIQLLRLFMDKQTKTLLILAPPSTI